VRHVVGSLTRYSSISAAELIREITASNDPEAWEEFLSRFHRSISLSIVRTAQLWGQSSRQLLEDLIQETYLKICADHCRLLADFAAQHPEAVSGYVKATAVNVVHDHFKAVHAKKRGAGQAQESVEEAEINAGNKSHGSAQAIEHGILVQQIDEYLSSCAEGPDKDRDRLIFWLHYQQGMSAKSIAALPNIGLTAKGVESAIYRLTRLVREKIVEFRAGSPKGRESSSEGFRPAESY
jgi:RNA polymerase sigma-70 factor (ECF subfamily)